MPPKFDLDAESERIARKALKVADPKFDETVASWKEGLGSIRDVEKWRIAVETALTVFEVLGVK